MDVRVWCCLPDSKLLTCDNTNASQGYESCTEGDAFIMSFPNPALALHFCMDVQRDLMNAAWPSEVSRRISEPSKSSYLTLLLIAPIMLLGHPPTLLACTRFCTMAMPHNVPCLSTVHVAPPGPRWSAYLCGCRWACGLFPAAQNSSTTSARRK